MAEPSPGLAQRRPRSTAPEAPWLSPCWAATPMRMTTALPTVTAMPRKQKVNALSGGDLLAAITEAGGNLRIADPAPVLRASYRRALHELINGDLLPPDKRLRYTGRDRGELVVSIVAIEDEPRPHLPPDPIPIPADLRGCHPLLRATRDAVGQGKAGWIDTSHLKGVAHLRIDKSSAHRCLRILQALVSEGERRGYPVHTGSTKCGGLFLDVGGFSFELFVKEETRRVAHVLTASEEREQERGYG